MHKKKGGEMQLQLLQLLESLTTFSLSPIWQLDASIPTPSNYLKVQKNLELCLLLPIQQNPHIHYGCFNFNLPYLYKFPLSSTICLHNSLPVHLPQVFFPHQKRYVQLFKGSPFQDRQNKLIQTHMNLLHHNTFGFPLTGLFQNCQQF